MLFPPSANSKTRGPCLSQTTHPNKVSQSTPAQRLQSSPLFSTVFKQILKHCQLLAISLHGGHGDSDTRVSINQEWPEISLPACPYQCHCRQRPSFNKQARLSPGACLQGGRQGCETQGQGIQQSSCHLSWSFVLLTSKKGMVVDEDPDVHGE